MRSGSQRRGRPGRNRVDRSTSTACCPPLAVTSTRSGWASQAEAAAARRLPASRWRRHAARRLIAQQLLDIRPGRPRSSRRAAPRSGSRPYMPGHQAQVDRFPSSANILLAPPGRTGLRTGPGRLCRGPPRRAPCRAGRPRHRPRVTVPTVTPRRIGQVAGACGRAVARGLSAPRLPRPSLDGVGQAQVDGAAPGPDSACHIVMVTINTLTGTICQGIGWFRVSWRVE